MKRFDCETDHWAGIMVEYDDGEFVRFDDLPEEMKMSEIDDRPGNDDLVHRDDGAKAQSEVPAAVARAIAEQPAIQQVQLASCPCGVVEVNLMIDLPQGSKVGRAGCAACGVWGVDFLAPRTQDQEILGAAAAKAWNEAPRAGHYEAP